MTKLTAYTSYADAQQHFSAQKLWELVDGEVPLLNIAHECIDRHVDQDRTAVIIAHAEGHDEVLSFREISETSSQVAHYLHAQGIRLGDRIGIMLEPSLAFYASLFGVLKLGAIAVPLFTLFGPDGLRLRVQDCEPRILITNETKAAVAATMDNVKTVIADIDWLNELAMFPRRFTAVTHSDDLAIFQYTSGTTRELPDAVRHTHRALVMVLRAALYGTGVRPGERFFCPSSPAWGHGLWHGTLAPLALGATIGVYSGRFSAERLLKALHEHRFVNISAAATHYRMIRNSGIAHRYSYVIEKLSFTGEPIDSETMEFVQHTFGRPVCSMYGTTEIGVVLVSYPGANDFPVKAGSLGKAVPGVRVEVHDTSGHPCGPNVTGELAVWRGGEWVSTKDLGRIDEDGYFYHRGRADDVIISAGWTISAVEIEDAVLKHPDVRETAAIGVADPLRGQVVKAFVVAERPGDEIFTKEIQDSVRERLSQHEYPRVIEYVTELPKNPAGKVNRKMLRDRERVTSEITS
ncbi:acyl-CoA synthetase [Paraburkholderia gardini]|uniref:acyl-CoA synthetase n=1 Tax=Paraburkholderia gardini TaxID=2823469 RepID=UPI001D9D9842|nr:acyl-CoA synthetase [Paraburkholderia gardini]CAG4914020.1 Acetyl-coenzyme A synthetase [Paraburkholderia gardini]